MNGLRALPDGSLTRAEVRILCDEIDRADAKLTAIQRATERAVHPTDTVRAIRIILGVYEGEAVDGANRILDGETEAT